MCGNELAHEQHAFRQHLRISRRGCVARVHGSRPDDQPKSCASPIQRLECNVSLQKRRFDHFNAECIDRDFFTPSIAGHECPGLAAVASVEETIPLDYREYSPKDMLQRAQQFCTELSSRRTVRDYDSRPIPAGVLEAALKTALSAPSGANRQPWRFVVVTDPELKRQIRERAEAEEREFYGGRAPNDWLEALAPLGTDEHKPFLTEAPALIAIFLERFGVTDKGKRIKNYYTPESVGIATGFLICALHHAGLATLTHTPSPMQFLNEVLDRPSRERAFLLLVVGYPKPDAQVPDIEKFPFEKTVTFR